MNSTIDKGSIPLFNPPEISWSTTDVYIYPWGKQIGISSEMAWVLRKPGGNAQFDLPYRVIFSKQNIFGDTKMGRLHVGLKPS